jgi:hypothetical protein
MASAKRSTLISAPFVRDECSPTMNVPMVPMFVEQPRAWPHLEEQAILRAWMIGMPSRHPSGARIGA